MRIVVHAERDEKTNPVLTNTYRNISDTGKVDLAFSRRFFWENEDQIPDIIHLHWPEYLFPWLGWEDTPGEADILRLKDRFDFWKSRGVKFVTTRHNLVPHRDASIYSSLYALAFQYSDAVIHYGDYSKEEFLQKYDLPAIIHRVIPHPKYEVPAAGPSISKARLLLRIPQDSKVFLVPGKIRNTEEQDLLLKAFQALPESCYLLVPRFFVPKKKSIFREPLGRINQEIFIRYFKWSNRRKRVFLSDEFLSEKEQSLYMGASDCVVIPRHFSLNSGLLPLGFSYGKAVVGPDFGNIGEILRKTDNAVFSPENLSEMQEAMKRGIRLAEQGLGEKNRQFAQKYWTPQIVGDLHLDLYSEIMELS